MADLKAQRRVNFTQDLTFRGLLKVLPALGYKIEQCDLSVGEIVTCQDHKSVHTDHISILVTSVGIHSIILADFTPDVFDRVIESLSSHLSDGH
jgi:hypothetical protein